MKMKINEKNLCVFATSPPYDFDGFLNKRGEINKAFQRRYFVLKGNLLFYFEKKGDKEPLGLIIVEGCTIELSEESDQYCFEIVFNGNRTYVLSADSQEVMEAWMKALTCAGYEYKKLKLADLQRQLEDIERSKDRMLSESTSTPKPPPERQNPFSRPAPLPPASNGTNVNKPFINGSRTAIDTSPVPPPRGVRLPNRQQDFHNNQCAKNSVLSPNSLNFEQLHEKYRKLVMKDVLEYQAQRELKSKPLIEL